MIYGFPYIGFLSWAECIKTRTTLKASNSYIVGIVNIGFGTTPNRRNTFSTVLGCRQRCLVSPLENSFSKSSSIHRSGVRSSTRTDIFWRNTWNARFYQISRHRAQTAITILYVDVPHGAAPITWTRWKSMIQQLTAARNSGATFCRYGRYHCDIVLNSQHWR